MPSAVWLMPFPHAMKVLRYWKDNPPEHELIAIALRVYTTWGKEESKISTQADHRASLEQRWKAGAMNAKQLFEATRGLAVSPMRT